MFYNAMVACKPNHQSEDDFGPKCNISAFRSLWICILLRFPFRTSAVSHLQSCHTNNVKVGILYVFPHSSSVAMPQRQWTTGANESVCFAPSWIPPRFPSVWTGPKKLDLLGFLGHIFIGLILDVDVLCLLIPLTKFYTVFD